MSKFPVCRSRNFVGMSKFLVCRVLTRNFQLGCRNFQFAEVEISSLEVEISSLELEISTLNSKFPVWRSRNFELLVGYIVVPAYWFINHSLNWKFRVRTGNFDFFKLEISTFQLEISSSNWKFRLLQTGNFDIPTGNFEFELEIFTLSNWKFRVWTGNLDIPTGNFELLFRLECGTNTLSYFRVQSLKRVLWWIKLFMNMWMHVIGCE